MKPISPTPLRSTLAALALAGLGCAHLPASTATAPADKEAVPARVVVTGSRIPQRVSLEGGLPATASPVRIYTREQLVATGRPQLGAALRVLDPNAL